MKKHYGIFALVSTCLICLAFLGGVYLGRNLTGSDILVSASPANTQAPTTPPTGKNAVSAPSDTIDINRATLSQLQTLPGIGPVLAQRILDYREENGSFTSPADLTKVAGIGTKRLEAILDHITVGG